MMVKLQTAQLLTPKGLSGCTLDCLHIYESFLGSETNNGALAVFKATLTRQVLPCYCFYNVLILTCKLLLDTTGHFKLHTGYYLPHWYSKGMNNFPEKEVQRSHGFLGNISHKQVWIFMWVFPKPFLNLWRSAKILVAPRHGNNCETEGMTTHISPLVKDEVN